VSVSADLSLEAVLAQMPAVAAYAAAAGLTLDASTLTQSDLRFFVTFHNAGGEPFVAEFDCRDFAMYPPTIEFVDAERKNRALPALYPAGFHTMPCICARYNRKAYSERGGPHGDWRLIDWQLPTSNGVALDTLTMVVSDLHSKISASTGRLG
jgi:hypothetical protein